MRLLKRTALLVALASLAFHFSARAQIATGVYAHGDFNTLGFDTINEGNLNVHFGIPIFSKAGRGGLNFSYNLAYDSSVWTPVGVAGSQTWQPSATWGWTADTNALTGEFTFNSIQRKCYANNDGTFYNSTIQSNFLYIDQTGTFHNFSNGTNANTNVSDCPTYGTQNATVLATDSSGLVLLGGLNSYVIQYPNGKQVVPPLNQINGIASVTDSNGNEITTTSTGIKDTTGTTVLTFGGTGTSSSPRTLTYPTYIAGSASTATATVHYASYNVKTTFGCSGVSEYSRTAVSLVDYVQLGDNEKYQFAYEATPGPAGYVTGRLSTITLPTGGRITYAYSGGSNGVICQDGGAATLTRSLPDDPAASQWSFSRTPGASKAPNSHTDVVDGVGNHRGADFVNDTTDTNLTPYPTLVKQYTGAASGTPILNQQSCYNSAPYPCTTASLTLPIVQLDTYSVYDGAQESGITAFYNIFGYQTEADIYDFGSASSRGSLLSKQTWTYPTSGNISLLSYTQSQDGAGNVLSGTGYSYDSSALTITSGLPQHISVSASRGNLTSISTYNYSYTSFVGAQKHFDDAGQVVSTLDNANNPTSYTYDTATDTFLAATTYNTASPLLKSTQTPDPATGLTTASNDLNSNSATYTYDNLLRLHSAALPGGGSQTTTYNNYLNAPTPTPATVVTGVLHSIGGPTITTTQTLDGYGRVSRITTTDSGNNDTVDYQYDGNGALHSVSNPYRTTTDPTYGFNFYSYDGLGRTLKVTSPDGSFSTMAYSGKTTTMTDAALKQRKIVMDGMGRIAQALEPDSTGAFNYVTQYLYYQNVNTTAGTYQSIVQQKGGSTVSSQWRQRTTTFDFAGRTVQETTPEAGTTNYTYGGSSPCSGIATLPCTRVDQLAWTTTYHYDAHNRLTGKTYSGMSPVTPAITYSYDQSSYNGLSITNPLGNRTGMIDASGQTGFSYDMMGRPQATRKTLNGVTKQANYSFNPDSTLNTIQDYSGDTLTYSYDSAGRQTGVSDATNTYGSGVVYNAAGELTAMTNHLTTAGGNFTRSLTYNSLLQPATISASLGGTAVQSFSYTYNASPNNNGDIAGITNVLNSARSQTFHYDQLNRLQDAKDNSRWGQAYIYDPWGNMTSHTTTQGTGFTWSITPTVNNQLPTATYDADGRVIRDPQGVSFTYDAEGRVLTGGSGSYVYDGDGYRVEKTKSSTVTLYWPSPVAGIIDESNSTATTFGKQIYLAGVQVWSEDTASAGKILFQDHLNSTRFIADASGTLNDDYDYGPFGDVVGNYTSHGSDIHYRFIGDETDSSESTTNFLNFRNLSYPNARFNRPDPYNGSYDMTNPQSLNRYSYVLNNPLLYADPDGEDGTGPGLCYLTASSCGAGGGGGGVGMGGTGLGNYEFSNSTYTTIVSGPDGTYAYAGNQLGVLSSDPSNYIDGNGNIWYSYTDGLGNSYSGLTGTVSVISSGGGILFGFGSSGNANSSGNVAPSNGPPSQVSTKGNLVCTIKGCIQVGPPRCSDLKKDAASAAAAKFTFDGIAFIPVPETVVVAKALSYLSAARGIYDGLRIAFGACTP